MDHTYIKLSTLLLPLFCLLWSLGADSTAVPLLSPPASAAFAADTLRSRGYSIFASLIISLSTTTNFSGTLLASPDFAFSFASAKILNKQRPSPRPSVSLLMYHTLSPPLILTWPALLTRDDGDELRTHYNNNCLYLLRNKYGEVAISSSPFRNPIAAVNIRQPDLYVDEHLTVHGIDGVLDPSFATKCSVPYIEPTADAVPRQVNRLFLDRAMRGLWRKGYNVVAAAMAIRRSELLSLTSVTVFAVSDETLFMKPGGFRYDFRHHVVPMRQRFADFEKSAVGRMELFTLAPNKTVVVETVDGAVSVDGVAMKMAEVYHNRWIVVLSVMSSLDDVDDVDDSSESPDSHRSADSNRKPDYPRSPASSRYPVPTRDPLGPIAPKNLVPTRPAPFSIVSTKGHLHRIRSPAPVNTEVSQEVPSPSPSPVSVDYADINWPTRIPSPAPSFIEEMGSSVPSAAPASVRRGSGNLEAVGTPSPAPAVEGWVYIPPSSGSPTSSPSPSPGIEVAENPDSPPTSSPARDDVIDSNCHPNAADPNALEGGDLLCPMTKARASRSSRKLQADVEGSRPRGQGGDDLAKFYKSKIAENVNIADDVFFYI